MADKGIKSYNAFSVKKKIILMVLCITAIPLILTTLVTSYISETALTRSVYENNQILAAGISREVNEILGARSNVLKTAASSDEILSGDPVRQLAALKNIVKQNPGISAMAITDTQGMQTVNTIPGPLANLGEREYFKKIKNGAALEFSDVIRPKGMDKAAVLAAVPIKDSQNKFLGTIVGVIDLQVLNEYVNNFTIGDTGYVFMVDRAGKILVHPDKSLVAKELPLIPPVEAALAGQTGAMSYEFQGQKKLSGYSSIPLTGWAVVAQQPLHEATAGATKVKLTGGGFTLAAIVVAVLVGILAAGALTRPIRELVEATGRLARGDLTAKASVTTKDELGQLAESFNVMAANLQKLIRGVISTADQVAAASEELSATSNEAERAINQIAGAMTEFAQGSHKQTDEVDRTLHIVQDLTQVSQDVAEKAHVAVTLSSEMAAAAEGGGKAARDAVDKINEIREVTADTSEVVTALGEKSNQIGNILDVISQIAGQTNLLALNAAIEAARAGEQGRGFAVVAEEVRKLAEQSQSAAQQIAQIVSEIQVQTAQAIEAMQSGSNKVNEGVVVVGTAGQALENILVKIKNSVSMIDDINGATNKQMQEMKTMGEGTTHIAVIARQTSAGAETTAAASEEISASMEEIASASQSLAELASQLQTLVAKFKI